VLPRRRVRAVSRYIRCILPLGSIGAGDCRTQPPKFASRAICPFSPSTVGAAVSGELGGRLRDLPGAVVGPGAAFPRESGYTLPRASDFFGLRGRSPAVSQGETRQPIGGANSWPGVIRARR
jgi:hypothetical protein